MTYPVTVIINGELQFLEHLENDKIEEVVKFLKQYEEVGVL